MQLHLKETVKFSEWVLKKTKEKQAKEKQKQAKEKKPRRILPELPHDPRMPKRLEPLSCQIPVSIVIKAGWEILKRLEV